MSIKWLMDVWMYELHIFKLRESLISSQVLCIKLKLPTLTFSIVLLILPMVVWFYFHPLILRLSQCLSANPPTVRSHFYLMWEYPVTMSFLMMFSSEHYTKCLYICLILPNGFCRGAKYDS